MGEPVKVPRDLAEMAALVAADRKMEGFAPEDIEDLRIGWREMAAVDMGAFRAYLEEEVKPIHARRKIMNDMIDRVKSRIAQEKKTA